LQIVFEEILGYEVFLKNMAGRSTAAWLLDLGHKEEAAGGQAQFHVDVDAEQWQVDAESKDYKKMVVEEQVAIDLGNIGYPGQSGIYLAPSALTSEYNSWYVDWFRSHVLNQQVVDLFPNAGNVTCASSLSMSLSDPGCLGLTAARWNQDHPLADGTAWMNDAGTYVPPQCRAAGSRCGEIWYGPPAWDLGIFETLVETTNMPYVITYLGNALASTVATETSRLGSSLFLLVRTRPIARSYIVATSRVQCLRSWMHT
jgi:hypothetical protein